ncbi:GNAT family N-acetyltransferase [Pelagibius sp. Alg239-R121]|uniref:GNAT family N-acetyltransferase n=1 Tax=Pelagibius sp. Alg239-R121 TaxID=2993448 RepID=UPI0024A71635|nr:GNAT family N-acetyltransferase [Pelagibius sp. Alg239-R121]
MNKSQLDIRAVGSTGDLELVVNLCNAFRAWLTERYPEHDWASDPFYGPTRWAELMTRLKELHAPPEGTILLATLAGRAAGCVMLQQLAPQICEMKRLFVLPECRGLAVGQKLCGRLIEDAAALGYRTMRLDTGVRHHEAQALYRSLGFQEIAPYYDCPEELRDLMLFMERSL